MDERRALGFGLSAVLLWSTVATAFKLTLAELTPIQMLTVASAVSGCVLLGICALQGKLNQVVNTFLANPWYYLLLGLINPLAYYLILFGLLTAARLSSASNQLQLGHHPDTDGRCIFRTNHS
ncbi:hypothetical protein VIOR103205_06830 [Vibrio ordalii]